MLPGPWASLQCLCSEDQSIGLGESRLFLSLVIQYRPIIYIYIRLQFVAIIWPALSTSPANYIQKQQTGGVQSVSHGWQEIPGSCKENVIEMTFRKVFNSKQLNQEETKKRHIAVHTSAKAQQFPLNLTGIIQYHEILGPAWFKLLFQSVPKKSHSQILATSNCRHFVIEIHVFSLKNTFTNRPLDGLTNGPISRPTDQPPVAIAAVAFGAAAVQ